MGGPALGKSLLFLPKAALDAAKADGARALAKPVHAKRSAPTKPADVVANAPAPGTSVARPVRDPAFVDSTQAGTKAVRPGGARLMQARARDELQPATRSRLEAQQKLIEGWRKAGLVLSEGGQTVRLRDKQLTLEQLTALVCAPDKPTAEWRKMVAEANQPAISSWASDTVVPKGAEVSILATPQGLGVAETALQVNIDANEDVLARARGKTPGSHDALPAGAARLLRAETDALKTQLKKVHEFKELAEFRANIGRAEAKAGDALATTGFAAMGAYADLEKRVLSVGDPGQRRALLVRLRQSQVAVCIEIADKAGSRMVESPRAILSYAVSLLDELLKTPGLSEGARKSIVTQRADLMVQGARATARESQSLVTSVGPKPKPQRGLDELDRDVPVLLATEVAQGPRERIVQTYGMAIDANAALPGDQALRVLALQVEKHSALATFEARRRDTPAELRELTTAAALALGIQPEELTQKLAVEANRTADFQGLLARGAGVEELAAAACSGARDLAATLKALPPERRALAMDMLVRMAEATASTPSSLAKLRVYHDVFVLLDHKALPPQLQARIAVVEGKIAVQAECPEAAVAFYDRAIALAPRDAFGGKIRSEALTCKIATLSYIAARSPLAEAREAAATLTQARKAAEASHLFGPAQLGAFCLSEAEAARLASDGDRAKAALERFGDKYIDQLPGGRGRARGFREEYLQGNLRACIDVGLAVFGRAPVETELVAGTAGSISALGGAGLAVVLLGPASLPIVAVAAVAAAGGTAGFFLGYGGVKLALAGEDGRAQIWNALLTGVSSARPGEVEAGARLVAMNAVLSVAVAAKVTVALGSTGIKVLAGAELNAGEREIYGRLVVQIQDAHYVKTGTRISVEEAERLVPATYVQLAQRAAVLPWKVVLPPLAADLVGLALRPDLTDEQKKTALKEMGANAVTALLYFAATHGALRLCARAAYGPGMLNPAVREHALALASKPTSIEALSPLERRERLKARAEQARRADPNADVSMYEKVGPVAYDPITDTYLVDRDWLARSSDAEVQRLLGEDFRHRAFNSLSPEDRAARVAALTGDETRWQKILAELPAYMRAWTPEKIVGELYAQHRALGAANALAAPLITDDLKGIQPLRLPVIDRLRQTGAVSLKPTMVYGVGDLTLQPQPPGSGGSPLDFTDRNGVVLEAGQRVRQLAEDGSIVADDVEIVAVKAEVDSTGNARPLLTIRKGAGGAPEDVEYTGQFEAAPRSAAATPAAPPAPATPSNVVTLATAKDATGYELRQDTFVESAGGGDGFVHKITQEVDADGNKGPVMVEVSEEPGGVGPRFTAKASDLSWVDLDLALDTPTPAPRLTTFPLRGYYRGQEVQFSGDATGQRYVVRDFDAATRTVKLEVAGGASAGAEVSMPEAQFKAQKPLTRFQLAMVREADGSVRYGRVGELTQDGQVQLNNVDHQPFTRPPGQVHAVEKVAPGKWVYRDDGWWQVETVADEVVLRQGSKTITVEASEASLAFAGAGDEVDLPLGLQAQTGGSSAFMIGKEGDKLVLAGADGKTFRVDAKDLENVEGRGLRVKEPTITVTHAPPPVEFTELPTLPPDYKGMRPGQHAAIALGSPGVLDEAWRIDKVLRRKDGTYWVSVDQWTRGTNAPESRYVRAGNAVPYNDFKQVNVTKHGDLAVGDACDVIFDDPHYAVGTSTPWKVTRILQRNGDDKLWYEVKTSDMWGDHTLFVDEAHVTSRGPSTSP